MKISKEVYKEIKKLNRQEMKHYLSEIYQTGFQDGAKSNSRIDFRIRLSQVLTNTKGIGPKLYAAIMQTEKELRQ